MKYNEEQWDIKEKWVKKDRICQKVKKIIKLVMNEEENKAWKEMKIKLGNISDIDSEDEKRMKKVPKAIIKKVIDKESKIISKIFTYEEADVLVIMDKDNKLWYRWCDIAHILEYKNTRDALGTHVDKKYKKPYPILYRISRHPKK